MSQSKKFMRSQGLDAKEVFGGDTGRRIKHGPGARKDLQKIARKLRREETKELRRCPRDSNDEAERASAAVPQDPRAFLELFARVGMTPEVRAYFEREESRFDADWRRRVDSEIARLQNV
jgi:hypothetical protein